MPYTIDDVDYNGTEPDPVEWANGQIKPAISDLDDRVTELEGAGGGLILPNSATPTWRDPYPPTGASHDAPATGTMLLWPLPLAGAFELTGLGIRLGEIGSATGYTIRLVVYDDTGDFFPGTLLKSSSAMSVGGAWENLGETFTAVDLGDPKWIHVGLLPIYSGSGAKIRSLESTPPTEPWTVIPNGTGGFPATSEVYAQTFHQTSLATPPATFAGVASGNANWQRRAAFGMRLNR